jgi:hypothetical protein
VWVGGLLSIAGGLLVILGGRDRGKREQPQHTDSTEGTFVALVAIAQGPEPGTDGDSEVVTVHSLDGYWVHTHEDTHTPTAAQGSSTRKGGFTLLATHDCDVHGVEMKTNELHADASGDICLLHGRSE